MGNRKTINCQRLYENCLYSSCAHAVYVLNYPFFAYEQSWDGINYSFVYGTTRGTISFDLIKQLFAGAVREDKSSRIQLYPKYNAIEMFQTAPMEIVEMAEKETIEYLYDEIEGVEKPVITTCFWGDERTFIISDTWDEFEQNGGQFPSLLCDDLETIKTYWIEQYGLSPDQINLVDFIYNEKCEGKRVIRKKEISRILKIKGKEPGYDAFVESLLEMGLTID